MEKLVAALPAAFTSRFGEVCWAQGGVGYGWFPSCIYDPRRLPMSSAARSLARRHLGKRHLLYFFQCQDVVPCFSVLPEHKITPWIDGLGENFHLGRAAKSHGRARYELFQRALQAAVLELDKPKYQRMEFDTSIYTATSTNGSSLVNHRDLGIAPAALLDPSPAKLRSPRKRLEEGTTSTNNTYARSTRRSADTSAATRSTTASKHVAQSGTVYFCKPTGARRSDPLLLGGVPNTARRNDDRAGGHEAVEPTRKRRGRPPKLATTRTSFMMDSTTATDSSAGMNEPRRRGRPPKQANRTETSFKSDAPAATKSTGKGETTKRPYKRRAPRQENEKDAAPKRRKLIPSEERV
jgi:hypothetical protein